MPLQDRTDYQEWIARHLERRDKLCDHEEEVTQCQACRTPATERQLIGDECIECLAFEFGQYYDQTQIADSVREIAAAFGSPASAQRAVMHTIHRADDLLSDLRNDTDAG